MVFTASQFPYGILCLNLITVISDIAINGKKKSKSDISYMPGAFWDKVIDFRDEPLAQCNVLSNCKNISLDDDNDGRK